MKQLFNAPKRVTFAAALILWVLGIGGTFLELPFLSETVGILCFVAATVLLAAGSFLKGL